MIKALWAFAKRKPVGGVCLFILLFFLVLALFGSYLAPQDPVGTNAYSLFESPSGEHWFGTDKLGRDVFSRVIAGAKLTYLIGVSATVLSLLFGMVVAISSAYYGGQYDMIVQRLVDVFMALPTLILAMAILAALGPSVFNVILAISLSMGWRAARVIRSSALSIRETEYVLAAKALGATAGRVMWRHMAPNTFATVIIVATAYLGGIVLTEASLSFLGIGVPPPHPSWGRDLSESSRYWAVAPWLGIFPGVALSFFVLAANLLGDALRDDLDPRLKRV